MIDSERGAPHMKLNYARNCKDPTYTIANTVRKNGKISTVKVAVIGKHSELAKKYKDPLAYAKKQVEEYNKALNEKTVTCTAEINLNKKLDDTDHAVSKATFVNTGYFFLQQVYQKLELNSFFRQAVIKKKIDFDCNEINRFLTYARIIDPCSKLGTFDRLNTYFEKPDFQYHQILRFMDILADNADDYIAHLFKASENIVERDTTVCYYDCTNYYFECEHEDDEIIDDVTGEMIRGIRQFGPSKEHRPNPIVEMGLIMDKNGIPLTMCIHPGNTSEQLTAIPLEKELIHMIGKSKFIYCADAGLGSYNIRVFNSMGGRAFIVTQSIKKLSAVLQQAVFNDCDFRLLSNNENVSVEALKTFDKTDENNLNLYNDRAYKILYADKAVDTGLFELKELKNGKMKKVKATGNLKQKIIITFSRKMMEYQRAIRNGQIERAEKMLKLNDPEQIKKGPNDVRRFLKRIAKTKSGEEAEVSYTLDLDKIREEEKYDGYYAIATNLDDSVKDILEVVQKRYRIEDCFRIMKTQLNARPVYHRKSTRITAHFLICYTALLIYRLIEVQLDQKNMHHTIDEIRVTLRNMNVTEEFNAYYKALYTGSTTLTDLVSVLGLPLDHVYYQANDLKKMIRKLL